VINGDDGTLARWSERTGISRRIFFGMAPHADVRLVSHELDAELRTVVVYDVCQGEARVRARLALLGEAAARNGAAALAVVLARGDDLEAAARGMERVQPTPGRMCPRAGNGLRVLDDTYNANPRSMALALDTAREVARVTSSRLVAVLGDMKELGARSAGDHAAIGAHAVGSGAKAIVFVGPEMAHAADAARAEASPGAVIVHVATTEEAVDEATALVAPGDVVLVKGSRSMATERVVVALLGEEGTG
jgi:UDP-N-acetylmuramoyl-tripeptide--D-alanyl-D-alanine ligase